MAHGEKVIPRRLSARKHTHVVVIAEESFRARKGVQAYE
jgi:hypothetical protein